MALFIREFHNKEVTIPMSKTEVDKKTGEEKTTTFNSVFRLNMSEVDPKITVFSFVKKIYTRVEQEPKEVVDLFVETGITIQVRIKTKESEIKEKGEYTWGQVFPRLKGVGTSTFAEVARDMFLCNQVGNLIITQYTKDNEDLNNTLYKEFENFQ